MIFGRGPDIAITRTPRRQGRRRSEGGRPVYDPTTRGLRSRSASSTDDHRLLVHRLRLQRRSASSSRHAYFLGAGRTPYGKLKARPSAPEIDEAQLVHPLQLDELPLRPAQIRRIARQGSSTITGDEVLKV